MWVCVVSHSSARKSVKNCSESDSNNIVPLSHYHFSCGLYWLLKSCSYGPWCEWVLYVSHM